jgi:hypothetical protein
VNATRWTTAIRNLLFLLMEVVATCQAQPSNAGKTVSLVEPFGQGRIPITFGGALQLTGAHVYGDVDRYIGTGWWLEQKTKNPSAKDDTLITALEVIDNATGIGVTYSLFRNPVYARYPEAPPPKRPESCRELDTNLMPIVIGQGRGVEQLKIDSQTTIGGRPLARASFIFKPKGSPNAPEKQVYGFYYNDPTCAKIRIVKSAYQPGDDLGINATLDAFSFEPNYTPTSQDYLLLGTLLYKVSKSYAAAAIYYQRALDTLPPETPLNARRVVVDQLSMSYGISGQIKQSRAVNEAAIKADPDYPLYYYNLACADADQGNADDAKLHLQQAFDRKSNTLPGEHLPDPTQDGSIRKLQINKAFWAFVQTLK